MHPRPGRSVPQQGAALITALIFLVILTMLGLSTMNTNVMEERMSSNSQEANRVFQAAESGVETAYDDGDAFQTSNVAELDGIPGSDTYDKPDLNVGSYNVTVAYNSIYRQMTAPPRGSGWDATMAYYHFNLSATATSPSGATTNVNAGAYQVGRRQ